jgi:phenylpropionate dioxygenase-like ring-hydroxylating dioxygenase large terminal subunit
MTADGAEVMDARTPRSQIWKQLDSLKGDELVAWRVADVPDRPSADERNLPNEYPFGWYGVGFSDELAVGQVESIRYFGKELALWRGVDGKARVIDAYCAHYGANMAHGGKVHENWLECPFHAWRYDEDGAVKDIPYAKIIPPQARKKDCVPGWPTREANGFIWVWYHPQRVAPMWELFTLEEVGNPNWTAFRKFRWNIYASIQNLADNGVDIAHFRFVHGTTEMPEYEYKFEGHTRSVIARVKLGTPRGVVNGEINSINRGPGQGCVRFSGLSDTLLVTAVTPVDRDKVIALYGFTQPRAEAEGPMAGLAKALVKDICRQFDQDKVILDRYRRLDPPLACDGDGPFGRNRVYYNQFYINPAPTPQPPKAAE